MNPVLEEIRAQRRAKGLIITGPERPVIGRQHGIKRKDPENAARAVEFYARYHGVKEPRLQLWR